jgi:adenosylmethionine-8-amino-7-oxononanoate aminotransferase
MSTEHDLAKSRTTREWQEADSRHYLHPFTDFKQLAAHGARIITSASGVYLNDSDGNRILDAMAGLWCVNVGYGRRELADAAYKQMLELPYYNSFFKSAHPPAIELARLKSRRHSSVACFTRARGRKLTIRSCVWCGVTGMCLASPDDTRS